MSFKAKLSYFALGIAVAIGLVFSGTLVSQMSTSNWTTLEQFEYLKCKHLMVVSDNDEPVATISATENGGLLTIADTQGTLRAAIGLKDGNSVAIQAYNENGQQSASLASNDVGDGQLILYDRNGQMRHLLAMTGDASLYTLSNAVGGEDNPSISLITDPKNLTVVHVRQGEKFNFLKPE